MKNRCNLRHFIFILMLILSTLFFVVLSKSNAIFDLVIIVWSVFFLYTLLNIRTNIAILCFLISFYVFLLGREVLFEYFGYINYYLFSSEINNHTYLSLLISLIGLSFGFLLYNLMSKDSDTEIIEKSIVLDLRKISKMAFYLLFIPHLIHLIYTIVSVQSTGYVESYQARNLVQIPMVINVFAGMAPMALYIFLATMPSKKESIFPIVIYATYNILTIFTGKRFPVVASFLFLIIYYVIREKNGEEWINKKHIIMLLVSIPLMIFGLTVYDYIRSGNTFGSNNIFRIVINFFDQLGGSINVIKRERFYSDHLQDVRFYSVHGLRLLLLENGFMTRIFGVTTYSGNSLEHALYGHSLAHRLSYLTYGYRYLMGRGVGSSYIAELFHDFGYLGVFLGSAIYGWILKRISMIKANKPIKTAILLAMIPPLLIAPRSGFDGFLATTFGIRPMIVFVSIVGLVYWNRRKNRSN